MRRSFFPASWRPVLLWALLILVLSLAPLPPRLGVGGGVDKVGHAAAYAVLAVLARRALAPAGPWTSTVAAVLLAVAYGGVLEVLQAVAPWRDGEWWDLLADGAGSLVAAVPLARARDRT